MDAGPTRDKLHPGPEGPRDSLAEATKRQRSFQLPTPQWLSGNLGELPSHPRGLRERREARTPNGVLSRTEVGALPRGAVLGLRWGPG